MIKINKDFVIDGTNKTLGDLANSSSDYLSLITFRDVDITGITSIASKSNIYTEFNIPQVEGYTPIAINLLNANGAANGLCVYSFRLQNPSFLTIYNGGGSTATPTNIKARIVYLKN